MSNKPLGKKQSRGWDVADDSSLVTSMTSSTRANLCHVCKGPEAPPRIKFVKCARCKCSWHPYCHTPQILDSNVSTLTCACCKKKEAASMSSPALSSMPPPAHQSAEDLARRCEEPNCTGIPSKHQATDKQLCKKHQIVLDHQRSKMKPPVAMKTGSAPKLFSKGKLYNFKPEDKQYLKRDDKQGMKRKRGAPAQRSDSSGALVGTFDWTYSHKVMADKPVQMQRPQPRTEFSSPVAPDQSITGSTDDGPASPEQPRSSLRPRTSNDSL
ncbi:hypothetical protein B0J14DRAFT_600658 [Halenospora varia]|nr:hypothetical protein B0J14DRAFT_600658 [Halenospora varia]